MNAAKGMLQGFLVKGIEGALEDARQAVRADERERVAKALDELASAYKGRVSPTPDVVLHEAAVMVRNRK